VPDRREPGEQPRYLLRTFPAQIDAAGDLDGLDTLEDRLQPSGS
jgi:hypothetical protein